MISRLSCGKVLLFLSSLLALCQVGKCEIRAFNLLLEPSSEYIHFIEGFLRGPGYIDLTELLFVASDSEVNTPQSSSDSTKNDGNRHDFRRALASNSNSSSSSNSGADFPMEGSALEIAVLKLDDECQQTRTGCDWTDHGVGAMSEDGLSTYYCCSTDAIENGYCAGTQVGRLIIDGDSFTGSHRMINVPASGEYSGTIKWGKIEETESGRYLVIFANCNDDGRRVIVEGHTVWKSVHGYLPGDLFGLMYFFMFLFVAYLGILLWYGITMKMFEDANIPIQSWIFGTICVGTLEVFFRSGDLFVWNEDGRRFWIAYYVGVILGVLKRGVSRCLLVMVSLGWGVVHDELGSEMRKIHLLGGLYIVISLVDDIMAEVAYSEIQRMSTKKEEELIDIVLVLGLVIVLINLIFYFWIIDSLSSTMEYLESMKQTRKLLRYLRLRMILMFSILFGVMWAVFSIVDTYDQGIAAQESKWVIDSLVEVIYLFVLVAVAWLWRPQENANEYAYVMELPAMSAAVDDDDDDGVIELSAVVPSAADDSDEDEFNDEIK